jgi:hypothetical protein
MLAIKATTFPRPPLFLILSVEPVLELGLDLDPVPNTGLATAPSRLSLDAANPKFGLARSPLPAMLRIVTVCAQDLYILGPLIAEAGVGQMMGLQQIGIILVASLALRSARSSAASRWRCHSSDARWRR